MRLSAVNQYREVVNFQQVTLDILRNVASDTQPGGTSLTTGLLVRLNMWANAIN